MSFGGSPFAGRPFAGNPYVPAAAGGDLTCDIDTAGAWTFAGQSITASINVAVGTQGAWALAGQAFTASINTAISTAGDWAWQGQTIGATLIGDITCDIDTPGIWAWQGQDFGVTLTGARGQEGGGRSKKPSKRRRKPVVVSIDGEDFVVKSEAEAVALIEEAEKSAEELARQEAQEVVRKREQKAKKAILNTAPLRLSVPKVEVRPLADQKVDEKWLAEVQAIADRVQSVYQRIGDDYQTALLLRKAQELDDEEALVALLLTI